MLNCQLSGFSRKHYNSSQVGEIHHRTKRFSEQWGQISALRNEDVNHENALTLRNASWPQLPGRAGKDFEVLIHILANHPRCSRNHFLSQMRA